MKRNNVMSIIDKYAGTHKYLLRLGMGLAGISALLGMIPYLLLWNIIRIAISNENLKSIKGCAWMAVGIMLISILIYVGALMCTHKSAFRIQANMRRHLMEHILKLPLGVFDKEGTGRIRRIVNESTAATETYIAHSLADKVVAMVTPIGLIILMLAFDWKIGLICLIPSVIGIAFMFTMMGKKLQDKMGEYQNSLEVMTNEATEYVRGIPIVKTFGQTVHSFKRFKRVIDSYEKWTTEYTKSMRKAMVGFMVSINAIFAALALAAYTYSKGGVSPELILDMMYYIIVTPLLTVTLTKIAYSGEAEMELVDAASRVDSIMEMSPLEGGAWAGNLKDSRTIKLEHVTYRYKDAVENAVDDLSIQIEPGQHVAFVGPSGGGKTTTAELIARFFDVTDGKIEIGGKNVKDIPEEILMQKVSFVFQDSKLLKGSILDNVRMGKKDATEEEVIEALKKAQCEEIIDKLPDGIYTEIGSKGTYVSGGEQQRISIARAILKNAPILILDEATAFADPDNEVKMQKAFEELSEGKTMIMIAHRLSTVVNTDKIFVLNHGKCVEEGSHKELLENKGLYRDMYEEYTKSVEWKVGA